jgi:hypothetical protein
MKLQKPNPMGSALLWVLVELDGPSAADEVHDDRDHGKDKEEVNEEAAHVQEKKSAEPKQNQHHSQD